MVQQGHLGRICNPRITLHSRLSGVQGWRRECNLRIADGGSSNVLSDVWAHRSERANSMRQAIIAAMAAATLGGCSAGSTTNWGGISDYLREATTFENICSTRHQAYQVFQTVAAIVPDKISPLAVLRAEQSYNIANAVCEGEQPTDTRSALNKVNIALSAIATEAAKARQLAAR